MAKDSENIRFLCSLLSRKQNTEKNNTQKKFEMFKDKGNRKYKNCLHWLYYSPPMSKNDIHTVQK